MKRVLLLLLIGLLTVLSVCWAIPSWIVFKSRRKLEGKIKC